MKRQAASLAFVTIVALFDSAAAFAGAVHRIVIDGPINPATVDYVESSIERARAADAPALIVELNTPGGLLNSTQRIVQAILGAPLPVLVYVAPGGASATSAGVFVTMAAHVAAMAPGTTIGAAHPVSGTGGDIDGDMRTKIENFAVSFGESIAARRGRNAEWAEKAVRESASITEAEAVSLRVVDIVADDASKLLDAVEGRAVDVAGAKTTLDFSGARLESGDLDVVDVPMTLRQRVLDVVADPNVAYLLMMAGLLGLYMELSNPGTVFPGVIGVICLLLALLAGQVLPISSTGIVLVVLGFVFLIAELFVPSFGVLGFGGLVALALGSLFLYTPDSALSVSPQLVAVTIGTFALLFVAIAWLMVRDRRKRAQTGSEGLIDARATTVTAVHLDGRVRVRGELWNARSSVPIAAGQSVRIRRVDGLELLVEEEAGRKEP